MTGLRDEELLLPIVTGLIALALPGAAGVVVQVLFLVGVALTAACVYLVRRADHQRKD